MSGCRLWPHAQQEVLEAVPLARPYPLLLFAAGLTVFPRLIFPWVGGVKPARGHRSAAGLVALWAWGAVAAGLAGRCVLAGFFFEDFAFCNFAFDGLPAPVVPPSSP